MAVPFDLARLEVTGGPTGILDGVMQDVNSPNTAIGETGATQFSVSESGALVYLPGGIVPDAEDSLLWVDRTGAAETIPVPPRSFIFPRLSPDGQRLSFSTFNTRGIDRNVWLYEISRGALSRLTTEGQNVTPIWTPDGKKLTFASTAAGPYNLFWKPADGSGSVERLTTDEHDQRPSSWSPDGKTLAFVELLTASNRDIWMLSLENSGVKTRPFL
jgi:Tol biopolymer transport system component